MLTKMLGERNCASTTFQTLAGRFGRQPLLGKLGAVMGDARNTNTSEMSKALEYILMITGGDAVSIDRKHIAELPTIYLPCRFTLAMNDLPSFVDHSLALEARSNILKFNNSHAGREDFGLKSTLGKEAAEGKMIGFALEGLRSLYTNNEFIVPQESAVALRTFRELISPISHFAEKCLEPDIQGPGVSTDDLYECAKWWRDREGLKPMAKSVFIRNLNATMPHAVQIMEGEVGNHGRMMMGIKITDWAMKAWEKGSV
jgi:phage/plasmid-associated DNA primase